MDELIKSEYTKLDEINAKEKAELVDKLTVTKEEAESVDSTSAVAKKEAESVDSTSTVTKPDKSSTEEGKERVE